MEKVVVNLPSELAEKMDKIVELMGFSSREMLTEAAIRRLLDRYVILAGARAVRLMVGTEAEHCARV